MSDSIQGTAREMGGRVQEKAGKWMGDSKTQAEGLYNQATGQAQQTMGQVSDMVRDQPLTAAIVALGIGYILGRLTA